MTGGFSIIMFDYQRVFFLASNLTLQWENAWKAIATHLQKMHDASCIIETYMRALGITTTTPFVSHCIGQSRILVGLFEDIGPSLQRSAAVI